MAKQLYRFEEIAGLKDQLKSFDALAAVVESDSAMVRGDDNKPVL